MARPPVGGASGTSVGGFGEQPGSFSGSSSGYAAEEMTLYPNNIAPFVAAELSFFDKWLTLIPQLRLQIMTFAGYPDTPQSFDHVYVALEPRLSVRQRLTQRVALKGAVGLYTQPPAPETLSRVFGNPELRPQSATHYVLAATSRSRARCTSRRWGSGRTCATWWCRAPAPTIRS